MNEERIKRDQGHNEKGFQIRDFGFKVRRKGLDHFLFFDFFSIGVLRWELCFYRGVKKFRVMF